MGYYKILSLEPLLFAKKGYKGLYRAGIPPYPAGPNKRLLSLWEKETEDYDKYRGISPKFTFDELREYAGLAAQEFKEPFEIIYFSEHNDCPHESEYYGVDVAGFGGYSMVGEGFFKKGASALYNLLISHFTGKLNAYGLFREYEDGVNFRDVIMELGALRPGSIEDEDWRVFHIFKVL